MIVVLRLWRFGAVSAHWRSLLIYARDGSAEPAPKLPVSIIIQHDDAGPGPSELLSPLPEVVELPPAYANITLSRRLPDSVSGDPTVDADGSRAVNSKARYPAL